ncbi:acyltransferase family protein [Duganella sp. CT11-25]|uniref:acyltransferase family protein n=1 Tax=unclassified Duganella TaxID=2636909 RepID=UPI0039AFD7EC
MLADARRGDIDGLRGIAVLSVMLFHFNPAWLPGGFAGVDVFFVISAYLITRILDAEMTAGQFSWTHFYRRRIKRIFPAFILVFGVTALLASQLNSMLLDNGKYALVSLYNQHTSDYFTQDTQKNFFLHFWSLSIEEQFYFIWPPLLACAFALKRRLPPGRLAPLLLPALTVAIAAPCFVLGQHWVDTPGVGDGAYFFSLPRFGELAIGALAAVLPRRQLPPRLANALTGAGAAGLALCFVYLRGDRYPGLAALAPCVCSAMLLYCHQATWAARALGLPWLKATGLVSYSLYLWHWPVLSASRFILGDNDLPPAWMMADLAVIVALTALTYRYVERPLLRTSAGFRPLLAGYAALSAGAMASVLMLTGVAELGIPPVLGAQYTNATVNGQNQHLTEGWVAPCWETVSRGMSRDAVDRACAIGASAGPAVLMVGDSHGAALGGFIDTLAKREGFSVTSYEVGACQIAEWGLAARAPGIVRTAERDEQCRRLLDYIERHHERYQAIFVVNAFNLFYGDYNLFSKTAEAPARLRDQALRRIAGATPVYFFYDSPVIDRSMQHAPLLAWLGVQVGANAVAQGNRGNALMEQMVRGMPGAHWIDLSRAYRELTRERFVYQGRPVYVDTNHLNGHGARALADIFIRQGGCALCQGQPAGAHLAQSAK